MELAASTHAQLRSWRARRVSTIDLRTRLFLDSRIEVDPEYERACARWLGQDSAPLLVTGDLEASRRAIETWLGEILGAPATMPNVLRDDTVAVQVNALRFASPWSPFNDEDTELRPFQLLDGTAAAVPTMRGEAFVEYRGQPHAEALTIELGRYVVDGEDVNEMGLRITFIVPRATHGLAELEASLGDWLEPIGERSQRKLEIPKVGFASAPLDLCRLFGDDEHGPCQVDADLSGLGRPRAPHQGLYIDSAVQETQLVMDERGVHATALTYTVTSVIVGPPPEPFLLNRPSLFVVHDPESGAVLFMGRVVEPRQGGA